MKHGCTVVPGGSAPVDSVQLLSSTATALDSLGLCDIGRVNSVEPMAWLILVLRHLPDDESIFPHGKWATIQSIEQQLDAAARQVATQVHTGDFQVSGTNSDREGA